MKKYLFIALALLIVVMFTGCDWFKGLFGLDTELSVSEVWIYEDFGALSSVDLTFDNDGGADAEDVSYILVFSEDETIDTWSDTAIYEGSVSWIDKEDRSYESVYWNEIRNYISNNSIILPVVEGYIGAIVDSSKDYEEADESDNTNYDWEMTYVPSYDSENDDDISSARNVAIGDFQDSYIFPESEADWFSFTVTDTLSDYIITVEPLGGASNMNLSVDLYDTTGSYYFTRDDYADGATETLTTLDTEWDTLNPGVYAIEVTELNGGLVPFRVSFSYY